MYPFKRIGKNCKISPKISVFNPENISVGDNVRIDDYVVLSGGCGLNIGSHIHIACYASFFAGSGIVIGDFCQIAAYCLLLSESDDFSGNSLIGPQISNPIKYKPGYKRGTPIILEPHVTLGARCTVLPGVILQEGAIFGAHSLINGNCEPWHLYSGTPIKQRKERSRKMLELADDFLKEIF